MVLNQHEIDKIIKFVKQEPKTVQDISKLIKRSWVTTNSYLQKIKDQTGQINIKTFREGTQGALKIVYFNHKETLVSDEIKEELFNQIRIGKAKTDFDFFEVFQFIPEEEKKAFYEEYDNEDISTNQKLIPLLRKTERTIYFFSGNLSFINLSEDEKNILELIEELLQKKILIKILCRVNIATITNLSKLLPLIQKYPDLIEIKHCYQPLRGFIIDETVARFKNEEALENYKKGELQKNLRIFYEIYNQEWIEWLQRVFWNLFRANIDYNSRLKQFKKFF
jgi:predicted transcriptional regulator